MWAGQDPGFGAETELTVVLPHFDTAGYLGAAVASVLDQDFRDLTLIVVDDASPGEQWLTALRPYAADPRLVVLRADTRVGPYRLKNAVLAAVRSPYVGFQDADDVSLPGRFRHQLAPLRADRADLVGCAVEHVNEAGEPVGRRRMPRNGNLWLRLGRTTVLHHPASVVRRRALERLGGFAGDTRFGADTDFHLRAAHLYRIRNVRRVLYRYRVWARSLTGSPETGFASAARRAYIAAMRDREQARRHARTPAELLPLLRAPANDVEFGLRRIRLTR